MIKRVKEDLVRAMWLRVEGRKSRVRPKLFGSRWCGRKRPHARDGILVEDRRVWQALAI